MFMNVADYTAKLTKERTSIDVDQIWENLFRTMQMIGKQFISEIRRSLIQTLENILMNHGQILSEGIWDYLF